MACKTSSFNIGEGNRGIVCAVAACKPQNAFIVISHFSEKVVNLKINLVFEIALIAGTAALIVSTHKYIET